jgi:hypothetical protein
MGRQGEAGKLGVACRNMRAGGGCLVTGGVSEVEGGVTLQCLGVAQRET